MVRKTLSYIVLFEFVYNVRLRALRSDMNICETGQRIFTNSLVMAV